MAFATRVVEYKASVQGFSRAATSIAKVDAAVIKAGGAVDGLGDRFNELGDKVKRGGDALNQGAKGAERAGDAAERVGKKAKKAEEGPKDLGESFDQLNDKLNKFWGRSGDIVQRLGDFEDLFRVLSGFALYEVIDQTIKWAQELYGLTEAGKAAKIASEATTGAITATSAALLKVSDASRLATKDIVTYAQAQAALTVGQKEFERILKDRLALEKQMAAAQATNAKWQAALARGAAGQTTLGLGTGRAAKAAAEEVDELNKKLAENDQRMAASVASFGKLQVALKKTEINVAALGTPLETITTAFDKLKGITDKVKREFEKGARDAEKAAKDLRTRLSRALDLTDAIDLDTLPPLDLELVVDPKIKPIDPAALIDDITAPPDFSASFESTREALKRRKEAIDAADKEAQKAAGRVGSTFHNLIDSVNIALESEGAAAWVAWANAAQHAIGQVQGMLGSFRVAFDAVTESTLTARANDVTQAEDALRLAERAERIAQANLDADKESLALKGAARRASEDRLKAEEAVYQAQLKQWEAEKQAAEAQKVLKGIEFALEGAKAAAKSIESFALASFLAALPFGAGAAFVPAAIAAGTTYAVAAAAYGVGAAATFAAPTPVSAKPVEPDPLAPLSESERGRTAGSGSGGKQAVTNVNVNFAGQVLATAREVQRAILQALKESEGAGGMPRPDFVQIGR